MREPLFLEEPLEPFCFREFLVFQVLLELARQLVFSGLMRTVQLVFFALVFARLLVFIMLVFSVQLVFFGLMLTVPPTCVYVGDGEDATSTQQPSSWS